MSALEINTLRHGVLELAAAVLGSQQDAAKWMATPHSSLGGATPDAHCLRVEQANQVKRILLALEWGGAA